MGFSAEPILIWFVIGYGVLMVALGFVYSKKVESNEDFILAGNHWASRINGDITCDMGR